jgi:hypothetical protein
MRQCIRAIAPPLCNLRTVRARVMPVFSAIGATLMPLDRCNAPMICRFNSFD